MNLDVRPWIGYDGGWPLEGPAEEECRSCTYTERQHTPRIQRSDYPYKVVCWGFVGVKELADRVLCTAPAMVVTMWVCHACGADNDVWGEGALFSWMQCGSCLEHSFLEWAMEMEESKTPKGSEVESVLACG